MADSPLASLFIATGVRDSGTTATLTRLTRTFDRTQASALGLLNTLDALQIRLDRLGMSGARNTAAMASNMRAARTEAAALNRTLSRQPAGGVAAGGAAPAPRAAGRTPLFGGGFGVAGAAGAFATIAGVTAGIRGVQSAAGLESASIRSAFAASEGGTVTRQDVARFQRESLALSQEFRRGVLPSAQLIQEIQQLGVPDAAVRQSLARAGTALNVVEPEVAADEAAGAIFRLIKSTTSSEEEFRNAGSAAIFYANAVKIAGDESAAGVPAVFAMVRDFQPIAKLAGAGADEIIALSGALSDLNESQRELFRTALLRVTGKQFQDPASVGLIGAYIGGEQGAKFMETVDTDPFEALTMFVERLDRSSDAGENIGAILNSLGFRNVRDRVFLQTFVNSLDKYNSTLATIREESTGADGTIRIMDATRMELESLGGAWAGLTTAVDRFTSTLITRTSPAIKGILSLLSGSVNAVTASPLLAAALLGGLGAAGIRGLRGAAGGGGMSGRFSGGLLNVLSLVPFVGPRLARRPNAVRRLIGAARGRFAAGRFAGQVGAAGGIQQALFGTGRAALGRNAARGAGIAGLFGGRAVAGRLAASGAGRVALGALGGPVGLVLAGATAVASLTPVFDSLGNMFAELGNRSGIVGTIFKTMSTLFKTMELGARGIGWVFQQIQDLFDNKYVRRVTDFFGKGVDWVNDKLDTANSALDRAAGQGAGTLPAAPAGLTGRAGTRIEVHNYSDGLGATQSIFDTLMQNAVPGGGAM